jgi:hypothetical protein
MRVRYLWPALILVAAACSGDADPTPVPAVTDVPATEAPAVADTTEAAAEGSSTTASLPEQCVSPPFDLEIRRSGDDENEIFSVVDAEDNGSGVREGGAMGYKIFMTDFVIDDDAGLIDQIFLDALPEGATLITLDLARFPDSEDPTPVEEYPNIAVGEALVPIGSGINGPDVLATQVTIATAEGTTSDFSVNSSETGEVLYADDTFVCVDVTIESEAGFQVSGIVTARVR